MTTAERIFNPKPTWIDLFPVPGHWTEADYYPLSDMGRIVELSNGNVEVLPMPTIYHQLILGRLFAALSAFALQYKLGWVFFAPLPVRLWPGKVREPDLAFISTPHAERMGTYLGVPDLVVEIISAGTEKTDREVKREEYAQAGIPEYWIIDPKAKTLDLLRLDREAETYTTTAQLSLNDALTSPTFPGFTLSLAELFAEAE